MAATRTIPAVSPGRKPTSDRRTSGTTRSIRGTDTDALIPPDRNGVDLTGSRLRWPSGGSVRSDQVAELGRVRVDALDVQRCRVHPRQQAVQVARPADLDADQGDTGL